jgi:hypothetical protein
VVVEDFAQCFIRLKSTLQRKNCMCDEYQSCISNLTVKIGVLAGAKSKVLFTFFKKHFNGPANLIQFQRFDKTGLMDIFQAG